VAAVSRQDTLSDTRLMVRIAQLYYRLQLSQEQVGERLGLSRFQVGRLLDRALREEIVRIEIVHPAGRLIELEDALVERFGLQAAVVADAPEASSDEATQRLSRDAVAGAAGLPAALGPTGSIGGVGLPDARAPAEPG
jgi:deoxyribonucleoside regulator